MNCGYEHHSESLLHCQVTAAEQPYPWDRFRFTVRETEVARLLVLGDSNKEVAGRLSVQICTVRFHVGNILKKTRADNRTRAALRLAEC